MIGLRRRPLWQRLSLWFGALLLACFGAAAWLQMSHSVRQSQRIEQRLLHRLADHIAAESQAVGMRGLDADKLAAVVERLRVTNPGIEVYALDPDGRVEMRHPAQAPLLRPVVDTAPIRDFLAGAEPPILGDDPIGDVTRKVFSVAPYDRGTPGERPGYLYAVLQGSAFDMLARPAAFDAAFQVALWSLGLVAPLGALAAVAAFRLVTRPLTALTRDVERLERDSRHEAGVPPPPAPSTRDEIALLRVAFDRLATTNERQWARLSAQDRQRRELVANISHDLRTPLASIHGYLETLLLKSGQLDADERDRYLRTALSQSQRLGQLAQTLLDGAKMELGTVRPQLEPFSLVELTLDVVQKLALAAQARGQRVVPSFPPSLPTVLADIAMIERVLTNLLDNAIRHSPPGGRIGITLSSHGERVRLEVADDGPGLPDAVFRRLGDGDVDGGAGPRSAGLGLVIVRQILRLHGDDLRAVDHGHGAVLAFSLRQAPP